MDAANSGIAFRPASEDARPTRTGGFSIFRNPPCMWPETMAGQPGAPLRVHLVDSDRHARSVIAQELMADPRTVVAGQAGSVREARRLLRDIRFDVLLVDLQLEDGPGLELIALSRRMHGEGKVVAMSGQDSDDQALRAFELGATGFVVKGSWFVSFVQAALQVANGGACVAPDLTRRLLVRVARTMQLTDAALVRVKLSGRELEVLRMIAGGLTSSEIGDKLAISCTTVNSHVKNMYHKLHVRTRAQAVSCASSWGLL